MAEDRPIVLKPANLGFEEAAALSFGGTTALTFLRRANIKAGESILVVGASGGVGTALVQLAKHFGAVVTGVTSTGNCELVKSIGADEVIDYTAVDFAQAGKSFDIIADTTGTVSFPRAKASLKRGGRLLLIAASLGEMLAAGWYSATSGKKVIVGPAAERAEDLQLLVELAESGRYRPVIDQIFPLAQIADAHRVVDSGRKRGNVIVVI
jgi:NADPH:quinone reductase-like Zn-dependent oxidoreductase